MGCVTLRTTFDLDPDDVVDLGGDARPQSHFRPEYFHSRLHGAIPGALHYFANLVTGGAKLLASIGLCLPFDGWFLPIMRSFDYEVDCLRWEEEVNEAASGKMGRG